MRPRITRLLRATAAALLLGVVPNWVPAATPAPAACSGELRPAFQDIPVALTGQARLTRTIDLPAGTGVLITASESSLDVRIEVRTGTAGVAVVSDNPVRRWGPQRVVVPAGPARSLSIQLIGKDGVRGHVRLSAAALPPTPPTEPCATALRWLAEADASYARAQLISLGLSEAPAGSASREYEAAARTYQRAAAAVASLGPSAVLAQSQLSSAAVLYQGLQNWSEALRMAELARESYAALRDNYGQDRARALAASAEMEVALGVLDAAPNDAAAEQRMTTMLAHARQMFIEVAARHAARGELYDQAVALNNLGLAFYYQDTYDPAIRAYQRAYALYERLGEKRRQAQTLQNIAVVEQELARYSAARESYARVLRLIDESADAPLFADVLNNLALTEAEIGEADAALRHFSQALTLLTRIQSVREQARSLQGIGLVYFGLGNTREALDYFNRALALRTAALDPLGRVDSLRWAANGLADLHRWPEAIALREEALRLAQSAVLRARILVELARDEAANGAADVALRRAQEALADDAGGDRIAYARALMERSRLRLAQSSNNAAKRDADNALSIFRSYELPASTFDALVLQARIACANRDGAGARTFIDEALTLAEPVRRASANPMLRTSLWQSLRPAFDFTITLLATPQTCGSGDRAQESSASTEFDALEVAERSRNRALSDYLQLARRRGETAGTESGAEARRRALFEDIAARRMQMELLLQRMSPQDPRVRALQTEVAALKRNIDIVGSEIAAPLKSAVGRDDSAAQLRKAVERIPNGTAVVEYWLGNDKTYAWLITKDRVRMVDLGSTSRITAAALGLHESLSGFATQPAEERVRRARELHDLIFAPLPEEVRRAGTLLVVPDGALHYVAFGVLAAAGAGTDVRYLIEDHDIAVAPSLLFDSNVDPRAAGGNSLAMLMVSDPVYSRADARFNTGRVAGTSAAGSPLRGSTRDWQRLAGSQREAADIARLLPAGSLDTLSGFDATREALLGRDLSRYRILHFATHGTADAEAPQLSTLVLSTYDRSGRSIAGEVFAGDLLHRPLNADLVVLSACDTSIGQETAGEGLLGLRYAAHASGARAVVASLWPVADVIGARMMADFYSRVVRNHDSPTAALSQVMRSARRQWFDPALWGVFEVSHGVREPVVH